MSKSRLEKTIVRKHPSFLVAQTIVPPAVKGLRGIVMIVIQCVPSLYIIINIIYSVVSSLN